MDLTAGGMISTWRYAPETVHFERNLVELAGIVRNTLILNLLMCRLPARGKEPASGILPFASIVEE